MLIRAPSGITKGQIVFATILGVIGGFYIWRPLFIEKLQQSKQQITIPGSSESISAEEGK